MCLTIVNNRETELLGLNQAIEIYKKKILNFSVFSTNERLRYSKDSESSAKNKNNAIFEIFYFTKR